MAAHIEIRHIQESSICTVDCRAMKEITHFQLGALEQILALDEP